MCVQDVNVQLEGKENGQQNHKRQAEGLHEMIKRGEGIENRIAVIGISCWGVNVGDQGQQGR